MTDYFKIEFKDVGFPYGTQLMGRLVAIQWEGKSVVGRVWSLSYDPEVGYYGIGIRLEPIALPATRPRMRQSNLAELLKAKNE